MRLRSLAPIAVIAVLVSPSVASAEFLHVVAPGESLSSVAAADGVSVESLAAANGLSSEAPLIAGASLVIPPQTAAAEDVEEGPQTVAETSAAETAAETSTAETAAETSTTETSDGDGDDDVGEAETGLAERGESPAAVSAGEAPYPTEETVTPSEVGQIAAEHSVPPSLAEAIAEQESGFNNGLTSSANARGVMQILPETWSWINQNLASSAPLAPASAASNVRGGVLLLQWLLHESEGDPASAAAGYYQGLESVRQEGEAPETEQYVNSVLALQERFVGE